MKQLIGVLILLSVWAGVASAASITSGSGGPPAVTAFPGSPATGDIVLVTDDSAVGACDSAAGTARTYCYYNGAAWVAIGDGSGAGAGDISDVWACTAGNCNALTGAVGDSFNAAAADSSRPATQSTTLPGTCSEGQMHQDTDSGESETYICTAANTWTKLASTTGNIATATALAADGANCAAGQAPLGVDTAGAVQSCTDYMEEPAGNGIVAKTGANTAANRTITGTSNQITLSNGDGVAGNPTISLSSTLVIPGAQIDFTESAGDGTCAAGDYWVKANSTTGTIRKCQNGTVTDLDTGGGGSIGGSTGATDRAVIIANGTGGSTVQSASGCAISAGNLLTCSGGFASTTGTGVLVLLEGTAPGAGTNAGEHNLYFNSGTSKLESHENGGSVVTYARTADNLSAFAATTSTELAGVLSDETGSAGGFVRATSPTIATPSISTPTFTGSAPTLADGVTWTFNPNGTSAGLNIGANATAPSVPGNGDMWYDSTGNKFKCRENGVTVDCISTGAGTGDVTDVVAGAGIAVATPGGPAPTVSWDASTFVNNITLWDGTNASRTITNNTTGTDTVWTYTSGTVNLSTGVLQVAGSDVVTASSSNNLQNKTIDAEGTGNIITIPKRIWLPAAGCNNATAGSIWDLPSSAPAVAACITGTNTQKGVLDFADGSNLSAQITYKLPSTWTGTVDANIKWLSATTTGDVVWQVATICVADAETDDPAFNTASTVTDTTKGTTNQTNDASITGVTTTGCAAGELMHIKVFRDSGHASDTMAGTARLVGVELVVREQI